MKQRLYCLLAATALTATVLTGCGNGTGKENKADTAQSAAKAGVTVAPFGSVNGQQVSLYTLTNSKGTKVSITNYGGTVTSWLTKDKQGNLSNIVVGFDSLAPYLQKPPYFGALIGRYGNRIAKAAFSLEGKTYQLAANDGANHLHGGNKGYDKVVWTAAPAADSTASLVLTYLSKDGEEGYPGNLNIKVRYTLTNDDELKIEYDATTDKATPVNLTNHAYFNLSGDVKNSIKEHTLTINAAHYTPVDATLIPTGKIDPVANTPFDFTKPEKIGARIDKVPGGYDHNYVLDRKADTALFLAARLQDAISGRALYVYTQEPGLQFYSGNFLDGTFTAANGSKVVKHAALCLETQHYPDSPNKPQFPSTILQPGKTYHTVTVYKVAVE
jgi:aldose 1-epimerase